MSRRRLLLLLLFLSWWAGAGRAQAPATDLKPTIILVSLDGWRWDYVQKYAAPTLERLIKRGVSGPLIPSFPSKTFPNHYTIVTGLYPGHHGIVANAVKDPSTGRRLTMSNRKEVQDPMWWGGEPLWVGVQRAGQIAAPLFWPGSEAPIMGPRARYWEPFSEDVPPNARIERVLNWLDLPVAERPTFLSLYFSDVDGAGHDSGPDSQAVRQAVRRVDGYIDRNSSTLVADIPRGHRRRRDLRGGARPSGIPNSAEHPAVPDFQSRIRHRRNRRQERQRPERRHRTRQDERRCEGNDRKG